MGLSPNRITGLREYIQDIIGALLGAGGYNDGGNSFSLVNLLLHDGISNGVTNKAPTENAVYDALALKQDTAGQSLTLVGQASAPAAPAAGQYVLYVLSADGKLYIKNSSNVAAVVGSQST